MVCIYKSPERMMGTDYPSKFLIHYILTSMKHNWEKHCSQWLSCNSDVLEHNMQCHADVLPNPWLKSWNMGVMSLSPNSSAWFTSACLTVLYPARTTNFLGPKCTVNTDPYFLDNCETNVHIILLMHWSVSSGAGMKTGKELGKWKIADRKFLRFKVIDSNMSL